MDNRNTRKYALIAAFLFLLVAGIQIGTMIAKNSHGEQISYLTVFTAFVSFWVGVVMLIRAKRLKVEAKKIE